MNYTFDDPNDYDYNSDEIKIENGKASLKLQQGNIDFTEDFADDTDFTYDSDKAEFNGGQVQQKDQIPTDATFGANYSSNINGNWGDGVLTGTAYGGAAVSGGKLDLKYSDLRYVEYPAAGNFDVLVQTGCIRKKYTPNYSGSPGGDKTLVNICENVGIANNLLLIRHTGGGQIQILVYSSTGGAIVNANLGAWSPTASQEYELELNFDVTTGATRFFIDGTQFGSTQTGTGTRSSSIGLVRIGANLGLTDVSNFQIDDLIIFSTVQHTSNYTPGYTVESYRYLETSVILPEMEHSGDGTIKLFNTFSTTETGSPRYTLQIGRSGNYLYWTGSAWATSDGTYTQANDATTFNTNCGSLDVDGEDYGQFKIIFPDSNTQSSVDELTANMNVDIGYLTTNPYLKIKTGFRTDELQGFIETAQKAGNDEIKYIFENDSQYYYWNGASWVIGDLIYNNSTIANDVNTNCQELVDESSVWYIYIFFHSDDGSSTPELDNLNVTYSFAGEPEIIEKCLIWGYNYDNEGNPDQTAFTVYLNVPQTLYKIQTTILREIITITPDTQGYWEIELIETDNMEEGKYIFNFGNGVKFVRQIPNKDNENFYALEL